MPYFLNATQMNMYDVSIVIMYIGGEDALVTHRRNITMLYDIIKIATHVYLLLNVRKGQS
jgi:hypothetical protein